MTERADEPQDLSGDYAGPVAMLGQRIQRVHNWVKENREAFPVLLLCIVIIVAGLVGIAYVLAGAQTALVIAILLLVVIPFAVVFVTVGDFALDALILGSPSWPRTSSLVRRVIFAGLPSWMAFIAIRYAIAQWPYAPRRAVIAGSLGVGLLWIAILMALDRGRKR